MPNKTATILSSSAEVTSNERPSIGAFFKAVEIASPERTASEYRPITATNYTLGFDVATGEYVIRIPAMTKEGQLASAMTAEGQARFKTQKGEFLKLGASKQGRGLGDKIIVTFPGGQQIPMYVQLQLTTETKFLSD